MPLGGRLASPQAQEIPLAASKIGEEATI